MKYLKSIFESRSDQDLTDLHDTCEMYLAYLIDNGFHVEIQDFDIIDIDIRNDLDANEEETFKWSDVKDHVIPLITLFNKGHFKYKLKETVLFYKGKPDDMVSISNFNSGRRHIGLDENLESIKEDQEIICLTIRVR
jgi:hypothetical protein